MNRNQELAKNTVIITVGKVCTQFISFFLMPLYTEVLSAEEYGVVDLVMAYTSLLMPVILLQVDQALFRFLIEVRGDEAGKKKIVSTAVVFALLQSIVAFGLFCVFQGFIKTEYKWFLLLNVLSSIGVNMMLQATRGFGDNITYAFSSFMSAVTQILGNIFAACY